MHIKVLKTKRNRYYNILNDWAKDNAQKLAGKPGPSGDILDQIRSIYFGAKAESEFAGKSERSSVFSVAYHTPVTGDIEFLIARTLYYYSEDNHLGWEVHLRRQIKKNNKMIVPDIRIERNNHTIGIIEIKARVGWMQAFFSKEQEEAARARQKVNLRLKDPEEAIAEAKLQLDKYIDAFDIGKDQLFMLIPSLKQAHRKKYSHLSYENYKEVFAENSKLTKNNLVVLTSDLEYEVGNHKGKYGQAPTPGTITCEFEKMVSLMSRS